jgi:glycosyltransferase involved in cell wall biosynthesis
VHDVVCLSPLAWAGLWTSRHELAQELAARGARVLFVDPPRNRFRPERSPSTAAAERAVPSGIRVVQPPPYLPYGALDAVGPVADAVIRWNATRYARFVRAEADAAGLRNVVLLNSFMPVHGHLVHATLAPATHVYHAADDLRSFPSYHRRYDDLEARVLERADVIVAVTEQVRAALPTARTDIGILRNGVDPRRFVDVPPSDRIRRRDGRPTAVVVGMIDHRTDLSLLDAAAEVATLHVAGKLAEGVRLPHGSEFHGAVAPEHVPALLAAADVALAPYTSFPGDPLKVYEYLAAGLPVVVGPAAGLEGSPLRSHLLVADGPAAFAQAIEAAAADRTPAADARRRAAAAAHSWSSRVDDLLALIDRAATPSPTHTVGRR